MIVCQCNVIQCRDIHDQVRNLKRAEPFGIITPGQIFKACGKRPNCGNCMPLFTQVLEDAIVRHRDSRATVRTTLMDHAGISGLEIAAGTANNSTRWQEGSEASAPENNGCEDIGHEGQRQGNRSA